MNTMQKVTAAASLLCAAVLVVLAAVLGPEHRLDWIVPAVACGLTGATLVAAFARGDIIVRLQKGTVVLASAAAVLALAVPVIPNRHVPGWQRRLAQYPALSVYDAELQLLPGTAAMDAADSIVAEHLLANQPELWRDYGDYVVAFARGYSVPVESVVSVVQRETAALRQHSRYPPELVAVTEAARQELLRRGKVVPARHTPEQLAAAEGELAQRPAGRQLRRTPEGRLYRSDVDSLIALRRRTLRQALDQVMTDFVWEDNRRRVGSYSAPTDLSIPDWPARTALAVGELLAGFATVIVLGLLRRKPEKTIEDDHAA